MFAQIEEVDREIELRRAELSRMVTRAGYDLHDPEVLEQSAYLDRLVIQWYRLRSENSPNC